MDVVEQLDEWMENGMTLEGDPFPPPPALDINCQQSTKEPSVSMNPKLDTICRLIATLILIFELFELSGAILQMSIYVGRGWIWKSEHTDDKHYFVSHRDDKPGLFIIHTDVQVDSGWVGVYK